MCWAALSWGQGSPLSAQLTLSHPFCLRCLKQMKENGFQPQQLFTDLALAGEEQAALLRAVVKAEPAFSPPPQAPRPVNTSTLLREIYAKVSPRHEATMAASFPSLCIGKTHLHRWSLTLWPSVPGSLMTVSSRSFYTVVCIRALFLFMA